MTIIATNRKTLIQALYRLGFSLVADLPRPIRIEVRRGMLIARLS